jgi:hypothetical protein
MKKNVSIALVRLVEALPLSDSLIVTKLSAFLAQAIGEKVNKFMSTKIKYTDEPLGKVEVVADMLPSPEELAFKEDSVKVTISLSKSSVDFFKREAKKHDTKYQQMIRRLLDAYTRAQERHINH